MRLNIELSGLLLNLKLPMPEQVWFENVQRFAVKGLQAFASLENGPGYI